MCAECDKLDAMLNDVFIYKKVEKGSTETTVANFVFQVKTADEIVDNMFTAIEKPESLMHSTRAFDAWMQVINLEKHTQWFIANDLSTLAKVLGVPTPTMNAILNKIPMNRKEIAHFLLNRSIMHNAPSNKLDRTLSIDTVVKRGPDVKKQIVEKIAPGAKPLH